MFTYDPTEYRMAVLDADGQLIDAADNIESLESVLYGDLSDHDGRARTILVPDNMEREGKQVEWMAEINADCFGIPQDTVVYTIGLTEAA